MTIALWSAHKFFHVAEQVVRNIFLLPEIPAHVHRRVMRGNRPLRVMRVLDAAQPQQQAGRMVISGRIDEVCAELDRLVALEAQHTQSRTPH